MDMSPSVICAWVCGGGAGGDPIGSTELPDPAGLGWGHGAPRWFRRRLLSPELLEWLHQPPWKSVQTLCTPSNNASSFFKVCAAMIGSFGILPWRNVCYPVMFFCVQSWFVVYLHYYGSILLSTFSCSDFQATCFQALVDAQHFWASILDDGASKG